MQSTLQVTLALVLGAAALTRLGRPRATQRALATFGIPDGVPRWAAWALSALLELGLAIGVAAGSDAAAGAAAALMLVYAGLLARALRAGRSGAPCGCFGARSRVTHVAVARTLLLAAAFAAVPFVPASPSTEAWLATGLVIALLGVAGLTVAVLALARELGMLRMRLAPERALDIPDEGPEIGTPTALGPRLPDKANAQLGLAVFLSDACPVCEALTPALHAMARDPVVTLATFDEVRDADVWRDLGVPGSPYAVATDREGVVRAKGTFNSFGQLESILATAERRIAEPAGA